MHFKNHRRSESGANMSLFKSLKERQRKDVSRILFSQAIIHSCEYAMQVASFLCAFTVTLLGRNLWNRLRIIFRRAKLH